MARRVHVLSSMRGQWLPGDPRGFRDRGHRIHSSGDYKNPPPPEEHAGLRRYAMSIADDPIELTSEQRRIVGEALVEKFQAIGYKTAAVACAATHTHALVRVGDADAKSVFGRAKQLASLRVTEQLPCKLWGGSSKVVRIKNLKQFIDARAYILRHKSEGAWTWHEPRIARELGEGGLDETV